MSNVESMPDEAALDALELALLTPADSMEAAVANFPVVQPFLGPAGLEHVIPFWDTYGDVSRTVLDNMGTGRFRREDDVAHTLPIFYNQARQPLLAYVQGAPEHMAPEWRRSLYSPAVVRAAPGIQFLMHMNAHINNDLAQALALSGVDDDYKHDYTDIVGNILEEVATQHADRYIPLSPYLRQTALRTSLGYIAIARERAWRNGKLLQAAQRDEPVQEVIVKKIERRAVQEGRTMLYLSRMALGAAAQMDARVTWRSKRADAA